MPAYCEPADVRRALQERDLDGAIQPANVTPAIEGVSAWLRRRANRHWYDSSGAAADSVATTPATATDVRLDVPASPHAHDRQIHIATQDVRYPVTHAGPFCKIPLPHSHVETVTALRVRDRGGDITEWTSDPDKTAGRGEDYYLHVDDASQYGRSHLYVRATSLGPRVDYGGLLTVDYEYGLDAQDSAWPDVRRGVALAAGAQLVVDDDVLTALPDNGQLVGVDTQRQALVDDAADLLDPYLDAPVA